MGKKGIKIAIVLALCGVGGIWLIHHKSTAGADPARAFESGRATRRDISSTVKATGVVRPVVGAEVRVGSRASGVVERLHVRVGDRVERGQVLAELGTRELAARRDQAAAALTSARVYAGTAAREWKRVHKLAESQALSLRDVDRAESDAALLAAKVSEAAAGLALARVQLDQARITASISGVVASVATQEGETVSASLAAPTFVTIIDLSRLELWAYVDETDIGRVQIGQPASFTVDTYPDRTFEGEVTAIHPKAEIRDNVVDYVVVIQFAPPQDQVLRPEMTANVRVVLSRKSGVLTVPRRAVQHEGGRTFILCSQRGRAVQRPVRTGAQDETHVEIVDGLREGEEVLVGTSAPAGTAG